MPSQLVQPLPDIVDRPAPVSRDIGRTRRRRQGKVPVAELLRRILPPVLVWGGPGYPAWADSIGKVDLPCEQGRRRIETLERENAYLKEELRKTKADAAVRM